MVRGFEIEICCSFSCVSVIRIRWFREGYPSTWKNGTSLRLGDVILRTSAPYSARMRVTVGPAMILQSSKTLIPCRICGFEFGFIGGNGIGGVVFSRGSRSHKGVFCISWPWGVFRKSSCLRTSTPACRFLLFISSNSGTVNFATASPIT